MYRKKSALMNTSIYQEKNMDEKLVLKLGRSIKVAKDTCITCGTKQWKCFNSIYSNSSLKKEIPKLLQLYCHINVTRGGMCNLCERALLKMNRDVEQFRRRCHKTLIRNRLVTEERLASTGIQLKLLRTDLSIANSISWPGKENLFVALAVCSNLPSALHHTITTDSLSSQQDVKVFSNNECNDHNYFKETPRICIKAECFSKPALVPLTNESQKTALPLARLAAMKIGEMMGTGSLGSARLCRHADKINKELGNIEGSKKISEKKDTNTNKADKVRSQIHGDGEEPVHTPIKENISRCTSVQEILNEADWLHRDKKYVEFDTKQEHNINDKGSTCIQSRKNNPRVEQSTTSNEPKQKRLKSFNNTGISHSAANCTSPKETKDIIHWESEWKKINGESVYFICPVRTCSEMLLECERTMHSTTHRDNVDGFCCPKCDFQHYKWTSMREHLYGSHFVVKQLYSCDQGCDQTFNSFVNLRQHMLYIHSFKSSLQQDSDTKKLLEMESPQEEEFLNLDLCSVCGMACKLEDLVAHEESHIVDGNILIECSACKSMFPADQIKDHVLAMHRKLTYLYQCDNCEFSSETSMGLKRHMGIKHASSIDFVCDKCGKGFKTAAALKVHHTRLHVTEDEKTVLCSTCGYLCAHETLLKEHIRKVHLKASWQRFKCQLCEHFSLRESSLQHHMQMYHSQSEERQFKCSICPFASKTKANLYRHQRTHKEYSPFQCPHCEFIGAKKQIIQDHIFAKHTKETPYSCAICGSAFSTHNILGSHMARHRADDAKPVEQIVTDEQQERLYFQL